MATIGLSYRYTTYTQFDSSQCRISRHLVMIWYSPMWVTSARNDPNFLLYQLAGVIVFLTHVQLMADDISYRSHCWKPPALKATTFQYRTRRSQRVHYRQRWSPVIELDVSKVCLNHHVNCLYRHGQGNHIFTMIFHVLATPADCLLVRLHRCRVSLPCQYGFCSAG